MIVGYQGKLFYTFKYKPQEAITRIKRSTSIFKYYNSKYMGEMESFNGLPRDPAQHTALIAEAPFFSFDSPSSPL